MGGRENEAELVAHEYGAVAGLEKGEICNRMKRRRKCHACVP